MATTWHHLYWKIILQIFSRIHDQNSVYNDKNLQYRFLDWKWPPTPPRNFSLCPLVKPSVSQWLIRSPIVLDRKEMKLLWENVWKNLIWISTANSSVFLTFFQKQGRRATVILEPTLAVVLDLASPRINTLRLKRNRKKTCVKISIMARSVTTIVVAKISIAVKYWQLIPNTNTHPILFPWNGVFVLYNTFYIRPIPSSFIRKKNQDLQPYK